MFKTIENLIGIKMMCGNIGGELDEFTCKVIKALKDGDEEIELVMKGDD